MKEPDAWLKLGSYIHQDIAFDCDDYAHGIVDAALKLSVEERLELVKYLAYLTDESRPGGTMRAAWAASGASWLPAFRKHRDWGDFYNEIAAGISNSSQ